MIPHGFIEVTTLIDGKKALIRTDAIDAVYENGPKNVDYGQKPPCTSIDYDEAKSVDVIDSFEDVCTKMWQSEL